MAMPIQWCSATGNVKAVGTCRLPEADAGARCGTSPPGKRRPQRGCSMGRASQRLVTAGGRAEPQNVEVACAAGERGGRRSGVAWVLGTWSLSPCHKTVSRRPCAGHKGLGCRPQGPGLPATRAWATGLGDQNSAGFVRGSQPLGTPSMRDWGVVRFEQWMGHVGALGACRA